MKKIILTPYRHITMIDAKKCAGAKDTDMSGEARTCSHSTGDAIYSLMVLKV